MSRYREAICKLCRREGAKLFLKGDRCYTNKCAFTRRAYAPGQHGQTVRRKESEYGIRLREKQKARRVYGIAERQFAKYFEKAAQEKGVTGQRLLEFLERRMDNVIYRLGFAESRSAGRQLVRHGNVLLNGRKMNIPSCAVRVGDEITLKAKMLPKLKLLQEKSEDRTIPAWLECDKDKATGKIVSIPTREQIDTVVEEQMIVEYYSR